MLTRFVTCSIALAVLAALAYSPAQAAGKHITNIDEKHKLIKERRPDEKNVNGARDVLRQYPGKEIAVNS